MDIVYEDLKVYDLLISFMINIWIKPMKIWKIMRSYEHINF